MFEVQQDKFVTLRLITFVEAKDDELRCGTVYRLLVYMICDMECPAIYEFERAEERDEVMHDLVAAVNNVK